MEFYTNYRTFSFYCRLCSLICFDDTEVDFDEFRFPGLARNCCKCLRILVVIFPFAREISRIVRSRNALHRRRSTRRCQAMSNHTQVEWKKYRCVYQERLSSIISQFLKTWRLMQCFHSFWMSMCKSEIAACVSRLIEKLMISTVTA